MTDAHAIPDAIQWHEGMLLTPQHFQQANRRADALLAYHVLAAMPYAWGIRRLRIDDRVLLDGVFRIDDVEAILPDGLVIIHPAPESSPPRLELDLKALDLDLISAPKTLHLAVLGSSRDSISANGSKRFRSVEADPVADENTGDGEVSIPRLRPRLQLLVSEGPGRPPPSLYVSLPIAVVQVVDDAFRLVPFAPAQLAVDARSALRPLAETAARLLRDKVISLSERLKDAAGDDDRGLVAEGWATVRALMQSLPRLEALLSTPSAHPFVLYLALCDTAGSVACLGRQPCPPQLPAYVHADPLPAYRFVVQLITTAIDRLRDPYRIIRFTRDAEGFRLRLEPAWIATGELLIGARPRPSGSPPATAGWLEQAWIGSASRLASIRARRIRGAGRRAVADGDALPFVPGPAMVVYHVALDGGFIRTDEDLVIATAQGEDAPGLPAEIVLYLPPADAAADRMGETPS